MAATTSATFLPMVSFRVILRPILPTRRLEPLESLAVRRRAHTMLTPHKSSLDHNVLRPIALGAIVLTTERPALSLERTTRAIGADQIRGYNRGGARRLGPDGSSWNRVIPLLQAALHQRFSVSCRMAHLLAAKYAPPTRVQTHSKATSAFFICFHPTKRWCWNASGGEANGAWRKLNLGKAIARREKQASGRPF